jgi:two-component system phosphate regulon sensor histidine kinase PhoR
VKKRAFVYFITLVVVSLIASSIFIFLSARNLFSSNPEMIQQLKHSILNFAIIALLAGIFLSYILSVVFSSRTIKPINQIISFSKDISNGNYKSRISIKPKDEMGELADALNKMVSTIDSTIADLKDKNTKFDSVMSSMTDGVIAIDNNKNIIFLNPASCKLLGISDANFAIGKNVMLIVRNRQINQVLEAALEDNSSSVAEISVGIQNEQTFRVYATPIKSYANENSNSGSLLTITDITNLKKLEQIRSDFVSNVTHELKTPLTSIRGFVETLKTGAVEDQNVARKFLDIIDIEAERLSSLINEILQLSEIESRNEDINLSTNFICDIVEETVSVLNDSASKKGVTINVDCDENIKIYANRDRIKQLFLNLIDNAINYNVDGGQVFVKVFRERNKALNNVYINIRDTGIGIEGTHLNRIFERFYRVDRGRSRNMGGTGLGLSIVKHIVYLYNGDIKVYSQPNKGTEFKIRLPIKTPIIED